jgi:transposase
MPTLTQTLGLDLGDRRSSYCLISSEGVVIDEAQVLTTKEALTSLFERLEPCRIAIEACGHVHWIAKLAEERGHEVIVADPRELRLISRSGRKNDRNDARHPGQARSRRPRAPAADQAPR